LASTPSHTIATVAPSKSSYNKEEHVDLDKAFVVKGVGSVVLGIVSKGSVAVHDTLYASSGKQAFRSIQSQDKDIELAPLYTWWLGML
jgi:Selenocysteine-specific translation elongation factor